MARNENPPIGRGEVETNSGAFDHLLGKEWVFEDIDFATGNRGTKPTRSARDVTCRLVKNSSGTTLLPKRLVKFKTGAAYGLEVDGYTNSTAERGHPVDEFVTASGVPDGAYFWIVVKGPATVKLPLAQADFNGDVVVGTRVVALTAATSGATTAGRVAVENITGSSQATDYTFLFNQIGNSIGRALSAATTANTNNDLLVDVNSRW